MSLPPGRGKFGYGIILFPDRIVILKFGFYGETKTGDDSSRQNIILNDSDMKTRYGYLYGYSERPWPQN